jgi:nitroimidazol reductase NimA-like FMN-containing flavoprotein (pyridoxamine 5'-phosphate oxidase superfamily)
MSAFQAPSLLAVSVADRPPMDIAGGNRRRPNPSDTLMNDPGCGATTGGIGGTSHPLITELTPEECRILLGLASVGRIAFVVDDYPMVLPVNYRVVNDDAGIMALVRTRPGNSIDRAPSHVALEIDGIDHEHHRAWSVLVRGRLHHIDEDAAVRIATLFDADPWPHEHRTSWLVISGEVVTGRRLESPEAEWPFSADAYR